MVLYKNVPRVNGYKACFSKRIVKSTFFIIEDKAYL
jgi:hypothetical protein